MNTEKDNSAILMKLALLFALAVPWGLLMFVRGGFSAFSVVPFILILIFLSTVLPNYFFYRRCQRFAASHGGTVASHSLSYSKFAMESEGIRTDFSITRGGRGTPTHISITSPFNSLSPTKFWLRPTDSSDAASRFFDKILDAHPNDKLLFDNKFMIAGNTISLDFIETILTPVKKDLLESLKFEPMLSIDGSALVLTVRDYNPNDERLSLYIKIIKETLARIQAGKNA